MTNTLLSTNADESRALALVSNIGAVGTIDAYISLVNKMPILSQEEETLLAERYQTKEDLQAAKALILSHLRLVVSISRQYLGYGIPHADLIQEGNIGLMKAVKRFDHTRGVRLVSFAIHWIKAEIHEYIVKNWRMVKVATTKAQRKLFFNLRSLKDSWNALSSEQVEEIAHTLQVRPEDVREMEVRMGGSDISLDVRPEEEEGTFSPISYLSDDSETEPTRVIANREYDYLQSEALNKALSTLDERSQHIVRARWLNDDSALTLQELAAQYGISAERVRQIETKALKNLQAILAVYK